MTLDPQDRLDLVRGAILTKRDSWSRVQDIYSKRPGDQREIIQRCRNAIKDCDLLISLIDGTEA